MSQIGRLAGCSSATVSRALSNNPAVSAKTREAVLRAMRQAESQSSQQSRSTRGRKRNAPPSFVELIYHRSLPFEQIDVRDHALTVGPLTGYFDASHLHDRQHEFSLSFYRHMIDAAAAELSRLGRRSGLKFCRDLSDESFLTSLSDSDCAGVLLVGETSPHLSNFIDRCPHPLVLVDIASNGWPDAISTDNIDGISRAFDHVYQKGHRKIGFVGREDNNFAYHERYVAYKMKMAEFDIPVRQDWVYEGHAHIGMAVAGVKKILSQSERPTALVCSNDCVALGAIRAAAALGLRVPADLSIIGFDDIDASALVTPALTTIRVPQEEIGRRAAQQLLMQIQSGVSIGRMGSSIRLKPALIQRESVGSFPSAQY